MYLFRFGFYIFPLNKKQDVSRLQKRDFKREMEAVMKYDEKERRTRSKDSRHKRQERKD